MRNLFVGISLVFCNQAFCTEMLITGYDDNPGVKLFQSAQYEQAEQYFKEHISVGDEFTELSHLYLAKYAILKNDGESAIAHMEQSLKIEPNRSEELMLAAEAYCTRAMQVSIFKALKFGKRCGKYYDLAASAPPTNPLALKNAVLFHWEAPSMAGGSKKHASQYLQQLQEISEESARVLLLLAKENDGGLDQALALADHFATLDYENLENLYDLAIFYRDKGQTQKAIDQFKRITQLEPNSQNNWHYADAVFQLGEQYIYTEIHREEGISLIEQYLTTSTDIYDPHFFWSRWRLARTYKEKGQMEQYEKLIQEIERYDYSHNQAFAKEFESADH